ncbi:polymorphic transmembrane cluster 2 transmembrane protein 2 [Biomphalaria pfeifferi]|uniref:Polymorphic transmembrane cluster 2 transmembrane protein 2 n=1 Tax=Biomphalaria pfeifferi TaxID=112525 RepID=A0AAD8C5C5_BIOPF|nr:polymorphic transmembrane cluster 2 transmembrane protein 2 [Biomphalaria pfeifferi]
MAFIVVLFIGLLFCCLGKTNLEQVENVSDCKPFEENQPHIWNILWIARQDESSEVAVEKDGVIYASCDLDTSCTNYFDHLTITDVHLTSDGPLRIEHKVLNATRKDEGFWSIKYIQGVQSDRSLVSSCYLRSYTRLRNVDCLKYLSYAGLEIICKSQRVYPKAKCHFSVHSVDSVLNNTLHVRYDHDTVTDGQTIYYNTACRLHIPLELLSNGTYTVNVNMYPDVTGYVTDSEYGNMTSLEFVIDESSSILLEVCEDNSTSLVKKVCVVKSLDSTPPRVDKQNSMLENVESKLQGKCDLETIQNDINIVCSYEHATPEGFQCQLFLQQNENQSLIVDAVSESLVDVTNKFTSYKSLCSFVVYGDFLRPGLYSAYVSATAKEVQGRSNKNITIYFELEVKRQSESIKSQEVVYESIAMNVLFVVLALAALVTVAIIALVIKYKLQCQMTCPKQQSGKKVDHDYEVVSDVQQCESSRQEERPMLNETQMEAEERSGSEPEYIVIQ